MSQREVRLSAQVQTSKRPESAHLNCPRSFLVPYFACKERKENIETTPVWFVSSSYPLLGHGTVKPMPGPQESGFSGRFTDAENLRGVFQAMLLSVIEIHKAARARWEPLDCAAQLIERLARYVALFWIEPWISKIR